MKVICTSISSKGFDLKKITTVFSNDFDYSFGGSGLEINKEYIVMGIMANLDSSSLYYLVDTNGIPNWFPYLLFEVSDNSLPKQWFIKVYRKGGDVNNYLVLGFDELCNCEDFHELLLDLDHESMRIYFRRKIEIERELEE